jgi:hypothetical protein
VSDRTIKQWSTADVPTEWTKWDIDLALYCKDAGQYEISFFATGGRGGLSVQSVTLVMGAVEAPEFITQVPGAGRVYRLNLTGVHPDMKLRALQGHSMFGHLPNILIHKCINAIKH